MNSLNNNPLTSFFTYACQRIDAMNFEEYQLSCKEDEDAWNEVPNLSSKDMAEVYAKESYRLRVSGLLEPHVQKSSIIQTMDTRKIEILKTKDKEAIASSTDQTANTGQVEMLEVLPRDVLQIIFDRADMLGTTTYIFNKKVAYISYKLLEKANADISKFFKTLSIKKVYDDKTQQLINKFKRFHLPSLDYKKKDVVSDLANEISIFKKHMSYLRDLVTVLDSKISKGENHHSDIPNMDKATHEMIQLDWESVACRNWMFKIDQYFESYDLSGFIKFRLKRISQAMQGK